MKHSKIQYFTIAIIRWFLFIPIYIGVILVVMYLVSSSLQFLFSFLGVYYTLLVMFFFFFIFWYPFRFVENFISLFIIRMCPHYLTGAIIFTILILLHYIWNIQRYWNVIRFEKGFTTFDSIVYSGIMLIISYYLITGAFSSTRDVNKIY